MQLNNKDKKKNTGRNYYKIKNKIKQHQKRLEKVRHSNSINREWSNIFKKLTNTKIKRNSRKALIGRIKKLLKRSRKSMN